MSQIGLTEKKSRTFDTVKPGLFGVDCGLFKLLDEDGRVFDGGWLITT
jgi:hypothetical protein